MLDSQKPLYHAGQPTLKPQWRIGRNHADAITTGQRSGPVAKRAIGQGKVTPPVDAPAVFKSALQHERHFLATVAVRGQGDPGGDVHQTRLRAARCAQDRLFDAHANGPPTGCVQDLVSGLSMAILLWWWLLCRLYPGQCSFQGVWL